MKNVSLILILILTTFSLSYAQSSSPFVTREEFEAALISYNSFGENLLFFVRAFSGTLVGFMVIWVGCKT